MLTRFYRVLSTTLADLDQTLVPPASRPLSARPTIRHCRFHVSAVPFPPNNFTVLRMANQCGPGPKTICSGALTSTAAASLFRLPTLSGTPSVFLHPYGQRLLQGALLPGRTSRLPDEDDLNGALYSYTPFLIWLQLQAWRAQRALGFDAWMIRNCHFQIELGAKGSSIVAR
jgi:hypothetical protein